MGATSSNNSDGPAGARPRIGSRRDFRAIPPVDRTKLQLASRASSGGRLLWRRGACRGRSLSALVRQALLDRPAQLLHIESLSHSLMNSTSLPPSTRTTARSRALWWRYLGSRAGVVGRTAGSFVPGQHRKEYGTTEIRASRPHGKVVSVHIIAAWKYELDTDFPVFTTHRRAASSSTGWTCETSSWRPCGPGSAWSPRSRSSSAALCGRTSPGLAAVTSTR